MKANHVPFFLMTHSALAVVLGLLCAWVIDLGNSAPAVVFGTGLGAGLLVSAGAVATPRAAHRDLWLEALLARSNERGAPRWATLVASDGRSRGPGKPRPSAANRRPHRRDAVAFPTFYSSASKGACRDASDARPAERALSRRPAS